MRVGSFPERAPVNRRSALDRFVGYAEQRYQDGCHNAAQLWRELREKGFRGKTKCADEPILGELRSPTNLPEVDRHRRCPDCVV
jgi:hypothetical protein